MRGHSGGPTRADEGYFGERVVGIDNSEAMLARLREKPGPERIEAMVGDMVATRVDGELSLV